MFKVRAFCGFALFFWFLTSTVGHGQHKPALQLKLTQAPTDYQVYQRDSVNRCSVTIKGKYYGGQALRLARKSRYKYIENYYPISTLPITVAPDSTFEITIRIGAELREWTFGILSGESIIAEFNHLVCGDVYAVLGQSNATSDLGGPDANFAMDGDTFDSEFGDRYARAVGQGIWGLEAAKSHWQWAEWGPASSIYYDFHHAGGWPLKLQHNIINSQKIPVGIINAALSGSYISEHFKDASPIAALNNTDGTVIHDNPEGLNARQYFDSKLARAGVQGSLKYIFWYQGESDGTSSLCKSHYADLLNKLIDQWSADLPGLEKVFVFQLNTSCLTAEVKDAYAVREAQRQVCQTNPKAFLIPTSGLAVAHMSDDEIKMNTSFNRPCHYNRFGMEYLADRVHTALRGLVYNNIGITPQQVQANEIVSATLNSDENKLVLEFKFDVELIDTNDAGKAVNLKDYFFDQDYDPISVSKLETHNNVVTLFLTDTARLEKISIYPASYYHHNQRTYYGPWLSTRGSSLGLPFFADVPIAQVATRNPVFSSAWNNWGAGSINGWKLHPNDIVLGGGFSNDKSSEVLLIDSLGNFEMLEFRNGDWEIVNVSNYLTFPKNLKQAWLGDFDGNGADEVLTFGTALSLYSIDSLGLHLQWVSDLSPNSLSKVTILTGDFNGNGITDVLLINTLNREMTLLSFEKDNGGQFRLTDESGSLKTSAFPFDYKTRFYSGDFNGDGQDGLLAFGEGAALFTLVNEQWEWIWSANLNDHFKGWNYPLDTDNLTLLVGNIDTTHSGDELMVIGSNPKETGISIYGFNDQSKSWSENETHLSKDPYLGDWPLKSEKGRNTSYKLIPNGTSADRLLTLREFECGGIWRYEAGLYNLNLKLAPAGSAPLIQNNSFYIFPNPTSKILHVESAKQAYPPTSINIYNQNGALVYKYSERFTPNNFILDLADLAIGLYLVEIKSELNTEVKKLIISR